MSVLFTSLSFSSRAEKLLRLILIVAGGALLVSACSPYGYGYSGSDALDFFIRSLGPAVQIVLILVGLALLLAGFAIYKFTIQLIGFVIGGIIGAALFPVILNNGNPSTILSLVGFLVGGVLGAWLAILLTAVMIFLMGAFIASALLMGLWWNLFHDVPSGAIILIFAILGGIALLFLYKTYIIVMTSIQGAVLFGLGIGADPWLWIVFFIVGVVVQYGWLKSTGKSLTPAPAGAKPPVGPQPAAYIPTRVVPAAPMQATYAPPLAAVTPMGGVYSSQPAPDAPVGQAGGTGKRFCSNCGAPLEPGAQFCGSCGTRL